MFTETLTRVTQGYTNLHLPVKMIPSIDFSKKMTVKFKVCWADFIPMHADCVYQRFSF